MRMLNAVTRRAGVLAAVALLVVGECALAAEMTPPDVLVKSVTLHVVGIISKDKDIQAGNTQKVIDLVEKEVLPHFNFTDMTALAAGQSWSKANAEEKQRLTGEFRTLLVRTYASALTAYRDQKFDFLPLHAGPTDTDVTVRVKVLQSGAQPVTIDYAMEKMPGGWQVYDVVVAGVSLVSNYRTEFTNEVRKNGVEGLIQSLHAKNQQLEQQTSGGAGSK